MSTSSSSRSPLVLNAVPKSVAVIVQQLVDAAQAVHNAAQAMKSCKDDARKMSRIALEIATCVKKTAEMTQFQSDAAAVPISVIAALNATTDVFVQSASSMRTATSKGTFARFFDKSSTVDMVGGYLAATNGLRELLKTENNRCGLMLEPFTGLGVDTTCTKDILNANITTVDATYGSFKIMLNIMVNITDGLQWPLKAAPQTLLYILKLFEDCQGLRDKITALLSDIQDMWLVVEDVSKVGQHNERLLPHLANFFETLQRIAIRLHVVLRTGQVKRALAIQTISACLELETERLDTARKRISLVFQGATLVGVEGLARGLAQTMVIAPTLPSASDMTTTTTLPPKPNVFNGRDELVTDAVKELVQEGTTRLAILGSGGIGKTSVALAVLHDNSVVAHFGAQRFFVSCEAFVDASSIVVSLATLLGLSQSKDLLTDVIHHLTNSTCTLVLLDNFETIWLAKDIATVSAVERLLKTFAEIPTLSFIITCRGNVLPPGVKWSNASSASLEPISLEAAVKTFEDIAGRQFSSDDKELVTELLQEVDSMPLAVALLGQLAQRGIPISQLLERWKRTHSTLLRTRQNGREYNVEVSIKFSLNLMCAGTTSPEPLQLLSVCSLLPDGLYPKVFERLRPHFDDLDDARQTLLDYAVAHVGVDGQLKTLSPVRHFVRAGYPMESKHHDALCLAYFIIAAELPTDKSHLFYQRSVAFLPELGNLWSLLSSVVDEPTQQIAEAVLRVTTFTCGWQPNLSLATALLPHLEDQPRLRAMCMKIMGDARKNLEEYRAAIDALSTAARLFIEVGELFSAAICKMSTGDVYRQLGEYDDAEQLFNEARVAFTDLGAVIEEARCRSHLARLKRRKGDYDAAIEHLTAATEIFNTAGKLYDAAQCNELFGLVHLDQDNLDAAVTAFKTALPVFVALEDGSHVLQCARFLASAHRQQGELELAEQLLNEVEALSIENGRRLDLAECWREFGYLRLYQRSDEAVAYMQGALDVYKALGMEDDSQACEADMEFMKLLLMN